MEERNITVTLNKAKEWFNSRNATLKKIALQAFDKDELIYNFRNITTFKKACEALDLNYNAMFHITKSIVTISKASAAMFKLNIIRKALNLGQDLHLTKNPEDSHIYYPYNPFVTKSSTYYNSEINSGKMEIIGKVKSEGEEYNVLGGYAFGGNSAGLGFFYSPYGVGHAYSDFGLLGCANKEIAKHLGKYFGMLITEAKYGDMVDFEILDFVKTKNADEKEYSVECSMTYNGHVKVNAESQEDAIEKAERLMDSKYGDDFPNYGKFGLVTFKFSDATADSAYEV